MWRMNLWIVLYPSVKSCSVLHSVLFWFVWCHKQWNVLLTVWMVNCCIHKTRIFSRRNCSIAPPVVKKRVTFKSKTRISSQISKDLDLSLDFWLWGKAVNPTLDCTLLPAADQISILRVKALVSLLSLAIFACFSCLSSAQNNECQNMFVSNKENHLTNWNEIIPFKGTFSPKTFHCEAIQKTNWEISVGKCQLLMH